MIDNHMTLAAARSTLSQIADASGLMRISHAALIAGVNRETIYRRIRRGELRAYGSPWRVAIADLLAEQNPVTRRK